jgi:steroid 5-alpha reductase family enzyme
MPLLIGLASLVALFTVLWLISLAIRNASIVDICWGLAFVVLALAYWSTTEGFLPRRLLMTVLVSVWGVRLAWYIGSRNIGHGEDFRYAKWRRDHADAWWWYSYFKVFLLQATIAWVVGLPLYFAIGASEPSRLTLADVTGAAIFVVGFLFEAIGDAQMRRFRADASNQGRVMDKGLWRYTRHPNYFGEALLWWGLGLIGASTPGGLVGLLGPAVITLLLLRVSGVTLLESTLSKTKAGYAEYVQSTSAFVPMPRKNEGRRTKDEERTQNAERRTER